MSGSQRLDTLIASQDATITGQWIIIAGVGKPFIIKASAGESGRIFELEDSNGVFKAGTAFNGHQFATVYCFENDAQVITRSGANHALKAGAAGDAQLITDFGTVAFKGVTGQLNIPFAVVMDEAAAGPSLGAGVGGFWALQGTPTKPQFTDSSNADHSLAMLDVATTWTQDHIFQGNVTIQGDTIQATSETLLADNHILLNAGYSSDPPQTCGLIGLNDPTTTTDTVAAGGFTAGVASSANPFVNTVGVATFSAGDIIQFDTTNDPGNNGIREVLSHAGGVLTIRGIGVTARVEDFTQNQFVTDATVAGNITKVNVSVHRCGLDGLYETAQGSATGFGFVDYALLAGQLGGTAIAPDVRGIRTTDGPTLLTIGAIADGDFLKRVGSTVVGVASVVGATQFAQLSDKNDQNPSVTTPVAITLDTNDALQGITHSETVNPDEITINEDGVYTIIAQPQVGKTSGATAVTFDMFMQLDTGSGFADVARTNVKLVVKDFALTDVLVFAQGVDLNSGDKIRLMQRTSSTGVGMGLKATAAEVGPPTIPATPSIIVTIFKVGPGV